MPDDARRNQLLAATALALVVFVTYANCLTQTFAFSDDFWLLWEWRQDPRTVTDVWNAAGRWTTAAWCHVAWRGAESIENLWQPRLGGLLGIYGLGLSLAWSLRRLGYSGGLAFTVAALSVLLPTFQVYAAWATCAGHVYGSLLSLAAFWLVERARRGSLVASAGWLAGGALLQLLAFTVYQPAAMFAVVLIAMRVVAKKEGWTRDDVLGVAWQVGVLLACMAGYLILFRLQSQTPSAVDLSERGAGTTDYGLKLARFVLQPVAQSCLPFSFTQGWSHGMMALVAVIALGGFVPFGLWQRLAGPARERALQIGCVLALIPLAYAPNLFVASDFFPYRTRPAIAVLILFLLVAAGGGWLRYFVREERLRRRMALGIAGVAIVGASLLARQHVQSYFIAPFRIEWARLSREVARGMEAGPAAPRRIVFLHPDRERTLAPQAIYDEFGRPNTNIPWIQEGLVGLVIRQIDPHALPAFEQAEFSSVPCAERTGVEAEGTWMIEMCEFP